MARSRARSNLQRGLIVLVDGFAIWALAVLLASYVGASSITGRGATPLAAIGETMRAWLATPGVGPFEGAAYLGLAIAVIGPVWYWIVRPVFGAFRRDADTSRGAAPEFEFEHRSTADTSADRTGRSTAPPATGGGQPTQGGSSGPADWADAVFGPEPTPGRDPIETALAQGDFLRSSGGSRSDPSAGEAAAADEGAPEEPAHPADRPLSDPTERTSVVDGGSVVPPDGDPVPAREPASGIDAGSSAPGADAPDDEGALAPGSDGEPADAMAALGSAVDEARTRLDAAVANLDAAGNGQASSVESTVAAIAGADDRRLDRLQSDLPSGPTAVEDAIEEIRASESRIEAAFEGYHGNG